MQGESPVQGKSGRDSAADDADTVTFGAQIVLHVVYDNQQSANVAGHKQHGYVVAKATDPAWFKSKDAFMGLVIKAFERFYDEMKNA